MYKPNNRNLELLKYLQETINELADPLEFAVWQMKLYPEATSGLYLLSHELHLIAFRFFMATNELSNKEAELYFDICWFFNINAGDVLNQSFSLEDRRKGFQNLLMERRDELMSYKDFQDVSSVRTLELFDTQHGTNHAEKAKAMYFRFANSLVKIDGNVSHQEQTQLNNFKDVLYSAKVSTGVANEQEAATPYAHKLDSDNVEKRQLNDLLAELSLLIGLERVKGDVSQLVNFLKVQQMREAKGLPVAPISRHLVFYGNPG